MTMPPAADDFLLIGQIVGPFGIRGQLKVKSYTDHVSHLQKRVKTVYVGPKRQAFQLTAVFEHKPGLLIVNLANVDSREAAEALRGSEVMILEKQAAPLADGEYFVHQLYGLQVFTDNGEEIGRVKEVITNSANDVLVVPRAGQTDALIPMIHSVIRELDIPNGRIVFYPMPGLLNEE
jgi:16S rRNA processing protein RimM